MRQRGHKQLGALENDSGVRRKSAGEMNAEVTLVLFKGAMNLGAVFTVGKHPALAERSRSIDLAIFEEKPLIGILGFYLLFAK
jgi:hypothetical protein